MSGLDIGWVLDGVPWDLGEALAPLVNTLRLHFEVALLCHSGVPAVNKKRLSGKW